MFIAVGVHTLPRYGALLDATPEQIESAIGMTVAHYIPWRAIRAGKQLSDSKGASAAISSEAAVLSMKRAMNGYWRFSENPAFSPDAGYSHLSVKLVSNEGIPTTTISPSVRSGSPVVECRGLWTESVLKRVRHRPRFQKVRRSQGHFPEPGIYLPVF